MWQWKWSSSYKKTGINADGKTDMGKQIDPKQKEKGVGFALRGDSILAIIDQGAVARPT